MLVYTNFENILAAPSFPITRSTDCETHAALRQAMFPPPPSLRAPTPPPAMAPASLLATTQAFPSHRALPIPDSAMPQRHMQECDYSHDQWRTSLNRLRRF